MYIIGIFSAYNARFLSRSIIHVYIVMSKVFFKQTFSVQVVMEGG